MINIESRIGSVALNISCEIKSGKESKVFAKGLASEVYRTGASKVFGPKAHKRDEAYSPVLDADVVAALKLVLAENFDMVEIKSEQYVKPAKITVESVLASLSDEALQAALDARKNGAETEDIG
jgi:hypothetical protein